VGGGEGSVQIGHYHLWAWGSL